MDPHEPSNDRQRTIAEAVDGKMIEDSTYESVVSEVVMSIPFYMSTADVQFLLDYAQRRFPEPAKKQPSHDIAPEDLKRSG